MPKISERLFTALTIKIARKTPSHTKSNIYEERCKKISLQENESKFFAPNRKAGKKLKEMNAKLAGKGKISLLRDGIDLYLSAQLSPYDVERIKSQFEAEIEALKKDLNLHSSSHSCKFCLAEGTLQTFTVCGHKFCGDCLKSSVLNRENALRCPCRQMIMIKDIKNTLTQEEFASLCEKIGADYLQNHSNFTICPIEECGALKAKAPKGDPNKVYSACSTCGQPSCEVCKSTDSLHAGCCCEDFELIAKSTFSLKRLYAEARKFVEENWSLQLPRPSHVSDNESLKNGCLSLERYCNGIDRLLKQYGSDYIRQNSFFAWHGTAEAAIAPICRDGFDPSFRSGQAYGPGEYFGQTCDVSVGYARGCSHMLVAQIIRCPEVSTHGNFCYVVNNPKSKEYYFNLPVLVVSWSNKLPPSLDTAVNVNCKYFTDYKTYRDPSRGQNQSHNMEEIINSEWDAPFRWEWNNNGPSVPYRDIDNEFIESEYKKNPNGISGERLLCRFVDDIPQSYRWDFRRMMQLNVKTSYERQVVRKPLQIPRTNCIWYYLSDQGWVPFESLDIPKIEALFQNYLNNGNNIATLNLVVGTSRPDSYQFDFVKGLQSNLNTQKVRRIKRE